MVQPRKPPRLITLVLAVVAVVVCMFTLRDCSDRLESRPGLWSLKSTPQ